MPGATLRVILAQDEPLFREGIRCVLNGAGDFQVVAETDDGRTAVEQADEVCADVLLLGFLLPGCSALEVLRQLKERRARVRVLLITAAINRLQTIEALELGARGVVMKDVAGNDLVRAIRAVVRGEYWVCRQTLADWTEYAHQRPAPRLMLSRREREIVELELEGLGNREIAHRLRVSEETVKTHISNAYRKLGVSNRLELALYAAEGKLRQPV